jgi:hypothetical protein
MEKKMFDGIESWRTFAFACWLVASLFGLQSGLINQVQYSVLTGVLIASAVIPTIIAQKWFMPVSL